MQLLATKNEFYITPPFTYHYIKSVATALWNIWHEYWIKCKKVPAPISSSNGFQVQKLIAFKCSTHSLEFCRKILSLSTKLTQKNVHCFGVNFFAATQDLELNRKAQRRKNGMRIFCGWTKSDQKSFSHKTWSIITFCFLLKILIILQCFRSKAIPKMGLLYNTYPTKRSVWNYIFNVYFPKLRFFVAFRYKRN